MGLLNFFKYFLKNKPATKVTTRVNARASMPTIKPDKEICKCYDEVFMVMIADISGISANDATAIQSIIKKCDGGFLNMGCYHSIIWEEYFKTKDWHWNEYEEWNKIFTKLGRFPSRFPIKQDIIPTSIGKILNLLTVKELKKIGTDNNIAIPNKAKKTDLVNIFESTPNIIGDSLVSSSLAKMNSRFSYELYSLFMKTINSRAKDMYNRKRAKDVGIKQFTTMHVFEEDKEFVEMALNKNPNALHPVFPSDMSCRKSELPF